MPDLQALLDQIDRLDQEATKGPWVVHPGVKYIYTTDDGMVLDRAWADQPDADLHLAALARTALPQLAKAVRAVTKECDRLKIVANNTARRTHNVSRSIAITQAADSVLEVLHEALGADHVA